MKKAIVTEIIVALLVLLFLYAPFSKMLDMDRFRASMGKQPFPIWMQHVIIWALPPFEILIAVLMVSARTRRLGLYVFVGLMGLFTAYIMAILLHVFPYVPCTCGGVISQLSWRQHLFFNLFFVALSVWAIWLNIFHARNQVQTAIPA